jgi:uncharacterized protein YbjQ (UPF0145 family)
MSSRQILMLTTNYAPGYEVTKVLGMVYGITVRSRGVGGEHHGGAEVAQGRRDQ